MEIRNVDRSDLDNALAHVNAIFSDNIAFKDIRKMRETTKAGPKQVWRVTLTVKATSRKVVDSERPRRVHIETLPGVKVMPAFLWRKNDRRVAAACWHVHGYFFDALPADAVIMSGRETGRNAHRPGDAWKDWNAGPPIAPFPASSCCGCPL